MTMRPDLISRPATMLKLRRTRRSVVLQTFLETVSTISRRMLPRGLGHGDETGFLRRPSEEGDGRGTVLKRTEHRVVADRVDVAGVDRVFVIFFFFQAEDGIRDYKVTGVQTCALPISSPCRSVFGEALANGSSLEIRFNIRCSVSFS